MVNSTSYSLAAMLMSALLAPMALQAGTPQSIEVVPYATPQERLLQLGACAGCDLRGLSLQGAHLIGVDLRDADLRGVDLREANLEGADLSGAQLDGADLRGARLSNADLTDTDLRRADLRDAVVINAYAPNVRTDGLRFAGADLTGSQRIYGGGPD